MASTIQQFLREHGISKSRRSFRTWPAWRAASSCRPKNSPKKKACASPEAIFLQTVTGDYPEDQSAMNPSDIDIVLKADPKRTVGVAAN